MQAHDAPRGGAGRRGSLHQRQLRDTVAALLAAARELGASGVVLEDEGPALPAG
jgi:hypothetical protein